MVRRIAFLPTFVFDKFMNMAKNIILLIVLMVTANYISCQDTVGLITNAKEAYKGYTLYSPFFSTKTYLIDMDGKIAKSWEAGFMPGANEYLTDDGDLLKACRVISKDFRVSGKGGRIQLMDNKGHIKWYYNLLDNQICQHHSILPMENGNIMAILWEKLDESQAIEMGRNPKFIQKDLYMLKLIEIKPHGTNGGEIVWEWSSIDHLAQDFDESKSNYGKISDHPELIDFNYVVRPNNKKDFLHANAIDINSEKDLILISIRAMDEIWIIDHSTNMEEAKGHKGGRYNRGGDLLFRWGNPKAYQSREEKKQTLFGQHDAHWISQGKYAGKVLVFNNGRDSIRPWSSVDIIDITLPDTAGKQTSTQAKIIWRYQAPKKEDFYSTFLSGAQILPNGNMLITQGQEGRIFEIDANKKIVWEFINPFFGSLKNDNHESKRPKRNYVYKAKRYDVWVK